MSVSIVDQSTGNVTSVAGNVNDKIGNLSSLITTDKSSVVAAINEVGGGVNEVKSALSTQLDWIFINRYDVTTTAQEKDVIPTTAHEILLIIGRKNSTQVYGGQSFIIPKNRKDTNIISTGPLYAGNGALLSATGVYVFWDTHNVLNFFAFDIESGKEIQMNLYYR